jgi:hypothetical protein
MGDITMARELRLSEEVQTYIDVLKNEGDRGKSLEQRREDWKLNKMVEIMIDDIIKSRETITDSRLKKLEILVETSRDLIEDFLDDRFTVEAVDGVQSSVKRLMKLSRLEAMRLPSKVTNGYLREAVRTYIFGFPQASIALSRAALEQALKENLGHQLSGDHLKMDGLLKEARKWGLLDRTMELCAREVAKAGDGVLHEKPTTDSKALEVLDKLRGLLQHIYSVTGRY